LCLTGGAAFRPPFKALFAAIGAGGPALGDGEVTVMVGVEADEGGFRPGLGLGDHDRSASLHAVSPAGAAVSAGRPRAPFGASLAAGVELGLADYPVVVGVEPVETGVGAAGAAGLGGGAALIDGHRAIAVGVGGGQAGDAAADELGLAEALIAIGVGAHAAGVRMFRGLLGDGDAARGGGEGQGGEAAGQKGLVHLDALHGRPTRPCIPVWRVKRRWPQSPSLTGGKAASKATRANVRASARPAFRAS